MKLVDLCRGLTLEVCLKILTGFALILMAYPLLVYPLPRYLPTCDLAVHYGWSFFISRDIAGLGMTLYPKIFHVTAALITNLSGLSIGTSIYLIVAASSLMLVYSTYKLAFLLTRNKDLSLLSSFFSVVTVVYIPANFGVTMPLPQSVALALMPFVLYLFASKKSVCAGISLAAYIFLHASWPLMAFLVVLYGIMSFLESRKASELKNLFITFAVALVLYVPYSIYMNSHVIYSPLDPFGTSAGISLVSFLWLVWPPGVFLLALYSSWRILYKKKENTLNYRYIVFSFLIILASSQVYLFGLTGPLVKVLFAENITIVPERFFTFSLFFMSVLCAYAVLQLTKGRKGYVAAVCLIAILVSAPYYWDRCDKQAVRFSDPEIEVIETFQTMGEYNKNVLYNPLYPGTPVGSLVAMGGQTYLSGEDAFLALKKSRTFNDVDVAYFLDRRGDPETKGFTEEHLDSMREIYSNDEYVLYEFTEGIGSSNKSLEDHIYIYSWHYNNYVYPKYLSDAFKRPADIKIRDRDTGQEVCVRFNGSMEQVECSSYDLTMEGSSDGLEYLFLHSYSILPSIKGILWLYNHGHLTFAPGDDTNITLVLQNRLHRPFSMQLFLYDVDLYLTVEADESLAEIAFTKAPDGPARKVSLRFFARMLEWIDPAPKYYYTYPNVIFGLPYALLMEAYEQCAEGI